MKKIINLTHQENKMDTEAPVIGSIFLGPYLRRFNPRAVEEMELYYSSNNKTLSLNEFLNIIEKMKEKFSKKVAELSLNDPDQTFQIKLDYHYGTYTAKLYKNWN